MHKVVENANSLAENVWLVTDKIPGKWHITHVIIMNMMKVHREHGEYNFASSGDTP